VDSPAASRLAVSRRGPISTSTVGSSCWACLETNTETTVDFVPFPSSPGWAEPAVADGLAATAGLRFVPLDLFRRSVEPAGGEASGTASVGSGGSVAA
jgi:hypothetical protein